MATNNLGPIIPTNPEVNHFKEIDQYAQEARTSVLGAAALELKFRSDSVSVASKVLERQGTYAVDWEYNEWPLLFSYVAQERVQARVPRPDNDFAESVEGARPELEVAEISDRQSRRFYLNELEGEESFRSLEAYEANRKRVRIALTRDLIIFNEQMSTEKGWPMVFSIDYGNPQSSRVRVSCYEDSEQIREFFRAKANDHTIFQAGRCFLIRADQDFVNGLRANLETSQPEIAAQISEI